MLNGFISIKIILSGVKENKRFVRIVYTTLLFNDRFVPPYLNYYQKGFL